MARAALNDAEPEWAIDLLTKLQDSGLATGEIHWQLKQLLENSYERLAQEISNTNGLGYILESVKELREGALGPSQTMADPRFLERIPLAPLLSLMSMALDPEEAMELEESLVLLFPDEHTRFNLTVRRGIVEIWEGEPLPGTPEPVAVLTMDSVDFRRVLTKLAHPLSLYLQGRIKAAEGS